jgi:hypothetical protein
MENLSEISSSFLYKEKFKKYRSDFRIFLKVSRTCDRSIYSNSKSFANLDPRLLKEVGDLDTQIFTNQILS